jgi:Flp pilus assembly protein TadD
MLSTTIKRSTSILALIGAVALAGCETTGDGAPVMSRAEAVAALPDAPLGDDPLSQATYWGARYEAEPDNPAMAIEFSSALRDLGSHQEAASLMARTAQQHPNNAGVLGEYARVMVAMRRGEDALQPLARAIALEGYDWRLYLLEGIAHDQTGNYASATQSYEHALSLSPGNGKVMNNYGLSRAQDGDLDGAEAMLRAAIATPDATAQMRQNLALVLGLQGRFDEAERFARADLPPEAVENNVAYYRAMLTQPAAWSDLEDSTQ